MSFFEFPHTRTYDSDLGWIIKTVHTHDEVIHALDTWASSTELRIKDLETFKDLLENGPLPDEVKNALLEWAALNIPALIGAAIDTVFFELTADGHLKVIIPDSWNDIIFGTTGLDTFPVGYDFGHLTLTY